MAKIYTKGSTVVDEVLSGAERYDIKDNGGTPIESNVQINLVTSVAVAGTTINAARLNNIENGIDAIDTRVDNLNTTVVDANNLLTTGGTTTAYTLTTTGAVALATGERFRVKFNATAGATPTLNRDSKGAKSLKYYDSVGAKQSCAAANIVANLITDVVYDGTDYVVLDPAGVTGGGAGGDIVATLVNAEVSVTTTATLTVGKMHVCSGTTADYTVTLPAASGNAGKFVGVRGATALTKKITIDGNASELVNGVASMDIQAGYSVILMCDGTNWFTISQRSQIGAWVTLNGTGTIAILASQNVSSVTDNSTGRYTVNFITAFPDANYCGHVGGANSASNKSTASNTTTSCQINFYETGVGYVDVNPATALFVR